MSRFWSEFVRSLEPYVPGEQPQIDGLIKLNTNESPFPPSPRVLSVLTQDAVDRLRLYPDPESRSLKKTIADYYQVNSRNVFVGNGSDEVLGLLFMAFFKQSKPLYFPDITYSFYKVYCQLFDIDSVKVPINNAFEIDFNDYPRENGGIIFPNPNAPTGIGKTLDEIEQLLARNKDTVVVVDEAYIDFGGETAISLVKRYENLVVVQTLSKSRALAGSRVGFAIAHESLIDGLERVKNSFNSYPIDRLAEQSAIVAFEDNDYFERCKKAIIDTREYTAKALTELGFKVLPSQANFVFAAPPADAQQVMQQLRDNKILVRHFSAARIKDFLRITIGTQTQMETLISELKKILS